MELLTSPQLPKNLEKTISDLARAREKSAKQKYLLDLGESLVMHLCSFVLGEYKAAELVSIDLEKSFLNNSKSVSFGVYLGWLREASKFLNAQQCPSEIHALLHGAHDFEELSKFIRAYEALKKEVEQESEEYHQAISTTLKNNLGKVNFLQFFDIFIQLRNRVAHPHKEVKGKMVSWPFSEAYFDAINPYLEAALNKTISELNKIWEFRQYIVDSNEEGKLILLSEESGEFTELENAQDFQEGVRVVANDANTVLLSDWKWLLRAGEEALAKIKQEEDDLRNKATIQDLQEAIKAALNDGQISLEELNFFESLGKTKMGLSKPEIKQLILEVAKKMNIEDPFPEVDKRFIEVIDQAITTKTYNEFLLKLTGQQYGVDGQRFETLFKERAYLHNVDVEDIRKNKVVQWSMLDFKAYQDFMRAHQWIYSLGTFRATSSEIYNMTAGAQNRFGTKEYWQRWSFGVVKNFVENRINQIATDPEMWEVDINNWQQGNLSGYAWTSFYPKNSPVGSTLALDIGVNNSSRISGDLLIGFLPNRKAQNKIENEGVLIWLFTRNLIKFTATYQEEIRKYPNLKMWDTINFRGNYSLAEIADNHSWFFDYLYHLDEIQFVLPMKELIENPLSVKETFDISFNLFNGLFDEVLRDYENLKGSRFVMHEEEERIREKMNHLFWVFDQFGLKSEKSSESSKKSAPEDQGIPDYEEDEMGENSLNGSVEQGFLGKSFRAKVKGYPLLINFSIRQNYDTNRLFYRIYVSCAGYVEPTIHLKVEQILESLAKIQFSDASTHFLRSKLIVVFPIHNVSSFEIREITSNFLTLLTEQFAYHYIEVLSLKVKNEYLKEFEGFAKGIMDQLGIVGLKNTIKSERNWMKGYRYLDYSQASNKGVNQWIGWGMEWRENTLYAGLILNIGNALLGANIKEQMELYAAEHQEFSMVDKGEGEIFEPIWIFQSDIQYSLSASSNKKGKKPQDAPLSVAHDAYWCAQVSNDKQWLQVQLAESMTISWLKIGAGLKGERVQEFNLSYSVDGSKWTTIEAINGLMEGEQLKEIRLENPINAKFLKIIPIQYSGNPALRFDILGKKISPSQIELHWMSPVNSEVELTSVFNALPEKIDGLKAIKGLTLF